MANLYRNTILTIYYVEVCSYYFLLYLHFIRKLIFFMDLISIDMPSLNCDEYDKCLNNAQFNFDNVYIFLL